jgi:hypothetical protein
MRQPALLCEESGDTPGRTRGTRGGSHEQYVERMQTELEKWKALENSQKR